MRDREEQNESVRRHYVFGLRDEVAAPEQPWTVYRHPPECRNDVGLICGGSSCVRADICRLIPVQGDDLRFPQGLYDIAAVLSSMTDGPAVELPLSALPARRMVAVVGSMSDGSSPGEHVAHCLNLLFDVAKALRHATQARTPNVTLERLWPLYAIVDEDADGQFAVQDLVIVEDGFRSVPIATDEQTAHAERALLAAWQRNPVETYLEFELDARRAVDTDGDYVEAVLKAATAAEVLIKHTAWMLTWEATTVLSRDPQPRAAKLTFDGEASSPRALIGSILANRLKGSWESKAAGQPVGAWRQYIAKQRNAILHRGDRPNADQARAAVHALDRLETHIVGRLSASADAYPRTALLLAGREALERRGAFDAVRTVHNTESLATLLSGYLAWLEIRLGEDVD